MSQARVSGMLCAVESRRKGPPRVMGAQRACRGSRLGPVIWELPQRRRSRAGWELAQASRARDSGPSDLCGSSVAGPAQRAPVSLDFRALSAAFISGVWPEGSDGTDINAVCRAHERKLLSTGDDFGKVHLFSYPCSQFRVWSSPDPALGARASWPHLAVW